MLRKHYFYAFIFYLNFWLDEKKKSKQKQELGINDEGWEFVENLWDRLKGNNSFSCKRKSQKINMDHKKTCIDFMVYCVNRDELKQICEQDDEDGLKEDYCDNFNKYTKHYYDHFTSKVTCLRDTNKYVHYNWRFSDTCTLHNMAKTFPKYDPSKKYIVDDATRQPIEKCESRKTLDTIDCYMLDGVPVTLEELSTTIDVIPLKYDIYAGSSFLGFFSLGLYLYKKTRHPSLIRTNSSRENKINKNTDKQFSDEQVKKSNSKNKDYKFSYNPIQN
ncbi:PIR protein [Plasmodium vivax]|uniref:VIR protein n=1 Tax=Plasmodium vivax TaxID=5855 RepID=A0A565A684_PLAVI|nr:PIR protein [Plasmodium vivax]